LKKESDSAIAKDRQHLAEATFRRAWAEGEKMTTDEAVDLALKTLGEI
jgi:hypothetical protein